jgi:hypothetical protein
MLSIAFLRVVIGKLLDLDRKLETLKLVIHCRFLRFFIPCIMFILWQKIL